MIFQAIAFVALGTVVLAAKPAQEVLGHHQQSSNFIQSSIFGSRHIDINDLDEPVILPPTFSSRGFDDHDGFAGVGTFARLDFQDCTKSESSGTFDIGIVGHPFDLGVTYRPGARFGPNGARQGARRIRPSNGWE